MKGENIKPKPPTTPVSLKVKGGGVVPPRRRVKKDPKEKKVDEVPNPAATKATERRPAPSKRHLIFEGKIH